MKQFALGKLLRLRTVQANVFRRLEELVSTSVVRVVEPALAKPRLSMYDVVDLLFKMQDGHHDRKHGKSRRHQDLQHLCSMINGDLLSAEDGVVTHFCWSHDTAAPCCSDDEECVAKMVSACACALFGDADPIPAESRWTSALANMNKLLLRRCAANFGIAAFVFVQPSSPAPSTVEVDIAASEGYFELVNRSRIDKVRTYFADPLTMPELVVFSSILEIADSHLLYPFLDDALREDGRPPKLKLLLDPHNSAVADCFEEMYKLLASGWPVEGGAAPSGHWRLLALVRAPIGDRSFLVWARSQVLRLASALFR